MTSTETRTAMQRLAAAGQSVWLDYIRRDLFTSGELADLVASGLRGMTSNPTIFQKAIAGSGEYDEALAAILADAPASSPQVLFERLAVQDIRSAADILRPVYDAAPGEDGFVSLEVAPDLAHDTDRTIADARRLWDAVDRPNLMIKVPATTAGIPAIETLIGMGINVNVTLMFSLDHYEAVSSAYLRGLEHADDPSTVASVASFFVSRVDTAVDRVLDEIGSPEAAGLRGTIAVANSIVAYARYLEVFGEEFEAQWGRGALPQRLLWASTGTKDAAYSDVKYVEELVGPHTVNTMPPDTLVAFEDHGVVAGDKLTGGIEEAKELLDRLAGLGVDLDQITRQLQVDGVKAFADSYAELLDTIAAKAEELAP